MARPNLKPRPRLNRSKAPFPFLALPTELRLQIYNYLTTYSYTYTDPPRPRRSRRYPLRRHGMLLANRQLHTEYAQAFYERTNFFFNIGVNNGTRPATTPFWTLPPALLPNLRQCMLVVKLERLAWVVDFSMVALLARIKAMLGCMKRAQWVKLVWDYEAEVGAAIWKWDEEVMWKLLVKQFVQCLKGGAGMRWITVTVEGRIHGNRTLKLERKGAEWVEVVPYLEGGWKCFFS